MGMEKTMLKLYFLGKANFECDGENITECIGNKAVALVCLLVLNQKKHLSREKIIAYLWPDSKEDAAKYNLRFNIWTIKKNIGKDENGEEFLYVDKERCGINEKYEFWCDILEVMDFQPNSDNSMAELLNLRTRFSGDFMEGCYFNNCNEFNEIIIFERMRFEDHRVKILKRLAEMHESAGELERCEEILMEILDIEPYDEEMALKRIRLYVKRGKRSKAIIYYNTFKNKLAGGLGIEPSENLQKAYEEIKATAGAEIVVDENISNRQKLSKNKENHKGALKITTECIGPIPYFWMADVLEKLAACRQIRCKDYINDIQLEALLYIQPEIFKEGNASITFPMPEVRIVNAFIRLLGSICTDYSLVIGIRNETEMDEKSRLVCQHLKNCDIANLKLENGY